MNVAAFLLALRRRTRLVSNARDPLAEAWRFLDAHGETTERQALRKTRGHSNCSLSSNLTAHDCPLLLRKSSGFPGRQSGVRCLGPFW